MKRPMRLHRQAGTWMGSLRQVGLSAALAVDVLALSSMAWAQTATIQGVISSFDVVNNTGQEAHGFEVQIEGGQQNDLYYTGYGQQYGNATVVPYATGMYIRWTSAYNATTHRYMSRTPPYVPGTSMSWQNCYLSGVGYPATGCEHFGQMLRSTTTITKITGRWLVDNPNHAGNLSPRRSASAHPIQLLERCTCGHGEHTAGRCRGSRSPGAAGNPGNVW